MGSGPFPAIDDWRDWVSATATRNYAIDDPLLDWLDMYGKHHGFERDDVDDRTDFVSFTLRKGREFENAVMDHLETLDFGEIRVVIGEDASWDERRSGDAPLATLEAMRESVPIIAQGALRHVESRTYGFPDLLVRSDVLPSLFPGSLSPEEAAEPAPGLGLDDCHYVVVDIKFTTLKLNKNGDLGSSGSSKAYKVQLYIYNRALGVSQGYVPPRAFLLGRGWVQDKERGNGCMERLAYVEHTGEFRGGPSLAELADEAVEWRRRLGTDGNQWQALREPSVPQLRPNAGGDPGSWKSAVQRIVAESDDLTRLIFVSPANRVSAFDQGFTRWTDPDLTIEALGVTGAAQGPRLQAVLDVNRGAGPPVQPAVVDAARDQWHVPGDVEFFVDFETVSDLDDDFASIPRRGGLPLIFMVGCGHLENGEWRFTCFTADELSEECELAVLQEWFDHMASVTERLAPGSEPTVFHWAQHERTELRAAMARHTEAAATWPTLSWFDFLSQVMQAEPVAVRGAFNFGLKEVANALHSLGLIDVSWQSGPADGQGAMVGAWWCQHQIDDNSAHKLQDLKFMQEIEDYNEIDCKVMMAIITYLRTHH